MEIIISDTIKTLCPDLTLGVITCKITNTGYDQELWDTITEEIKIFKEKYTTAEINKIPIIKATREAYKKCGKEANRYRPSSEALSRRLCSDKGLYQISTGVDLINLISFKTGYSIGAFDADNIEGDLNYAIGEENEIYNGIGRGFLNVQGLPILRDEKGGIGTPTSDEERTKLSLSTSSLLVNINGYLGTADMTPVIEETVNLLVKYLKAEEVTIYNIS